MLMIWYLTINFSQMSVTDPYQESMMTIYAMVSAEKEGQIESKVMKAVCENRAYAQTARADMLQRQLEEIREARAKEIEGRQQTKRDRIVRTNHTCLIISEY